MKFNMGPNPSGPLSRLNGVRETWVLWVRFLGFLFAVSVPSNQSIRVWKCAKSVTGHVILTHDGFLWEESGIFIPTYIYIPNKNQPIYGWVNISIPWMLWDRLLLGI